MSNHDDHRTRVLPAGLKPVAAGRGNMSSSIEIFADSNDVKFTSFSLRKSESARRYSVGPLLGQPLGQPRPEG